MTPLVVGVDVARATVVAATWSDGAGRLLGAFPNTEAGYAALTAALPPAPAVQLVLEPTGGYEQPLALFALQRGWQVSLPTPRAGARLRQRPWPPRQD